MLSVQSLLATQNTGVGGRWGLSRAQGHEAPCTHTHPVLDVHQTMPGHLRKVQEPPSTTLHSSRGWQRYTAAPPRSTHHDAVRGELGIALPRPVLELAACGTRDLVAPHPTVVIHPRERVRRLQDLAVEAQRFLPGAGDTAAPCPCRTIRGDFARGQQTALRAWQPATAPRRQP
jgi:hypothetical protein